MKSQVKISAFSDIQKLKEFITIKSPLKEILKDVSQGKGKRYQIGIYTKETREPEMVTALANIEDYFLINKISSNDNSLFKQK